MTDVWCRKHYCIHNLIGKCALDSIGLMLANDVLGDDDALTCAQHDNEEASTDYVSLEEQMACDEHNGR